MDTFNFDGKTFEFPIAVYTTPHSEKALLLTAILINLIGFGVTVGFAIITQNAWTLAIYAVFALLITSALLSAKKPAMILHADKVVITRPTPRHIAWQDLHFLEQTITNQNGKQSLLYFYTLDNNDKDKEKLLIYLNPKNAYFGNQKHHFDQQKTLAFFNKIKLGNMT